MNGINIQATCKWVLWGRGSLISLQAGQNFPPAGQISLQCGMVSRMYFLIFSLQITKFPGPGKELPVLPVFPCLTAAISHTPFLPITCLRYKPCIHMAWESLPYLYTHQDICKALLNRPHTNACHEEGGHRCYRLNDVILSCNIY